MENRIDVRRLATDREIKIVRDALTIKRETARKNHLDTIGEISFIISCLFCLAAYIQCG